MSNNCEFEERASDFFNYIFVMFSYSKLILFPLFFLLLQSRLFHVSLRLFREPQLAASPSRIQVLPTLPGTQGPLEQIQTDADSIQKRMFFRGS